jgi:phosphate-selective porin OprO and OprP
MPLSPVIECAITGRNMLQPRQESRTQTGVGPRNLLSCFRRSFLLFLLVGLFAFVSGTTRTSAQDPDSPKSQTNSTSGPSTSTPVISWDDGLHIRSRNGEGELTIGGEAQFDDRLFVGSPATPGVPAFILRRGRVVLIGTGFKRLGFRITAESRRNGPVTLRDAYVSFDINRRMQIRLGKFKSGLGLERNQSNRYLMLAERAFPSSLTPDRDIGMQLLGEGLGNKVVYMGGIFRGVPDGSSSEDSAYHGADAEFRVFTHPFRGTYASPLGGLGLGLGASAGNTSGSLPSFTTAGLERFFRYRPGAIADGERTRISPQADYYWRRIGVMAEYALSTQDVRLGDVGRRVANTAWQTSASFVLTGESASYSGVTPAHVFNPADHHWGAFEVAGRWNSLHVDPSAYPILADPHSEAQQAAGFQAGLNWYPQKYVKFAFNYARTRFTSGATSGDRPTENAFIIRVQLSAY